MRQTTFISNSAVYDGGGLYNTFGAPVLENDGACLEDVQAILGHAHIGTTRSVYARTDRRTLRDIYDPFTRSPRQAIRDLEERERREERSNREPEA